MARRRSIAVRLEDWKRRGSPTTPGLGSGAVGGTPILEQQFGDTLHLMVEVAWGADLTADPATWPWSEVTTDVQVEDGSKDIQIRVGRADEATTTQPAQAVITLNNQADRYSKSALSPNWPNVKPNTPVRIRLFYQGISNTRFFGYATSWKPGWDTTGNYAIVTLTAHGALRRLNQGNEALRSVLERTITASTNLLAYWPMEDGTTSATFSSAVAGGPNATFTGMTLAAASGLRGSAPLPTFNTNGTLTCPVPGYTATQFWEVRWVQLFTQPVTDTVMLHFNTTGTFKTWEIVAGGSSDAAGIFWTLNVYDAAGTKTQLDSVTTAFLFNNWAYCKFFVSESAGTLTWFFEIFAANVNTPVFTFEFPNGTVAGVAGALTAVTVPASTGIAGYTLGHVAVWKAAVTPNSGFIDAAAAAANAGENAAARLTRLCTEQGELISISGTSTGQMGPQEVDTFVNLLRACEKVDQGLLYDGFGPGLSFLARAQRENTTPALTLDASQQDLTPPWQPEDDDLLTVNKFTASRVDGSTVTFEDTNTSVLGTDLVGVYDSGDTFDNYLDDDLVQYASWKVHLGTATPGYRFPAVAFSLHRRPGLVGQWLNCALLSTIAVTNPHTALSQMPPEDIHGSLQGYTERIGKFLWEVAANCTPADPWTIAVLAADSGDTNAFLCRLDTDGANVSQAYPAGSPALSVVTPSGPVWTTNADDFPLYVMIGGLRITVTNVTNATSPQVFTVDPTTVLKQVNDGDAVTVWDETVLGL